MPAPYLSSKKILKNITEGYDLDTLRKRLAPCFPSEIPLPQKIPHFSRCDKESQGARIKMLHDMGKDLSYVTGNKGVESPEIFEGNIECHIGSVKCPVGVIGPLRINGRFAKGDFYVPLATTEGTLVASHHRGARLISKCGGTTAVCLTESVCRAPSFMFNTIVEAGEFLIWTIPQFERLQDIVATQTSHGKLVDVKSAMDGNQVYLIFEYETGDAAGQNMVTFATQAICEYLVEKCPIKPRYWFVEGNLSGDKKATSLAFLYARGKKVTTEVVITKRLLKRYLHTTPEMLFNYWKTSFVGGVQSGSLGVQGHYANGLAAIFLACGQDLACVAEASIGLTRMDLTEDNDLYVAVTLPGLIVGTVGGGTGLPTQRECLELIDCYGDGKSRKFAEICAATVLCGEISLMGALAAGEFAQSHQDYGRKKKTK